MKFIQQYTTRFLHELYTLTIEMAPYLLLGFIIAGAIHAFLPKQKINRWLGKSNNRSVLNAALFGIPLPLCSCGVIPTGVGIYKNGASKGASVSFLISTPQTGVDSIMATYGLMGLPFAIIRPVIAFITGVFGGWFTNKVNHSETSTSLDIATYNNAETIKNKWLVMFKYALVDFLGDIAKWIVIGLLLAAAIGASIPDQFFSEYIRSDFLGMLIILIASVPLYVCATSSIPIAAMLILKGLSPGAALVFLMAGPATNAATITVIGKAMGRKTLVSYMASIIAGALLFGIVIDYLLPQQWFNISAHFQNHEHELLPMWLQISSALVLLLGIANVFIQKLRNKIKSNSTIKQTTMNNIKVTVKGMNCSHCKANVESNLEKIEGIKSIDANIEKEEVTLTGDNINLNEVKKTVESIGYKYIGKKAK